MATYSNLKLSLLIGFIFASISSFAQGGPPRFDNERIESLKVSFITQKMDLSPEESKIFWPIYNEYKKEQEALRKAQWEKMISFTKVKDIDELSDTEIQAKISSEFYFRQQDLNIERKYYSKLKSNLPLKIVGKFYRAQEAFKSELLKQYYRGGPRRDK